VVERRIRIVFEPVGGAAAADDAERLKSALGELPASQEAATDGAAELRAELERLRGQVQTLEQAQQRGAQGNQAAAASSMQHAQSAIALAQRLSAATNAIAGMASSLGGADSGLARGAGLIGRLTASAAAGAQLGLVLGPQGALVGGILGAAIPALEAFISAQERADASSEAFRTSVEATARALETELGRLREREDALSGEFGDRATGSLTAQQRRSAATIAELERQLAEAREVARQTGESWEAGFDFGGGAARAEGAAREVARLEELVASERQVVDALHEEISARQLAANAAADQAAATARVTAAQAEEALQARQRAEHEAQRERFAAAAARAEQERTARSTATLAALEQRRARELEQQAEYLRLLSEAIEKEREHTEAIKREDDQRIAEEDRRGQERERAKDLEHRRAVARLNEAKRLEDELRQKSEREAEQRTEQLSVFGDLATGVSRSLVKAVGEIAAGSKTAEEAFLGMLGGFLEAIAEQCLISAAREYAEALAAIARYDAGGFAGHLAAGLAFTGVALATGAAAGAIAAAPSGASQQAARPDQPTNGGGDSGRVVYVTHWNAPVHIAGSEAEAGRSIERLSRRAVQRYGPRVAA